MCTLLTITATQWKLMVVRKPACTLVHQTTHTQQMTIMFIKTLCIVAEIYIWKTNCNTESHRPWLYSVKRIMAGLLTSSCTTTPSRHTTVPVVSDGCLQWWKHTAAGLSGILTRFPFKPFRSVRDGYQNRCKGIYLICKRHGRHVNKSKRKAYPEYAIGI